jgi:UDP-N-acetylglucosamine:LPS N-acetylglucosamine transferase
MKIKPVVLILTDQNTEEQIPLALKQKIEAACTHYGVVLKRRQYDNRFKGGAFAEKFYALFSGGKKKRDKSDMEKLEKKFRKNRIYNAVLRFKPESIVCLSAHALSAALDAKKKTGFETPILALMNSFSLDKEFLDISADAYIVENLAVKAELERSGIPARAVAALGFPVEAAKISAERKAALKYELGLLSAPAVFLNCPKTKNACKVLDMLLDQGDIINLVVYYDDGEISEDIKKMVKKKGSDNVKLFDKEKSVDEYLAACDIVVTGYDPVLLYKSLELSQSVILLKSKGETAEQDYEYFKSQGLAFCVDDVIEVVTGIYKILQTELKDEMAAKIAERGTESGSAKIAEFILSLGKNDG